MKKNLTIVIILIFACCSRASVNPSVPKTVLEFPSEQEVTAFLKIGISKEAVVRKFGEPLIERPQPAGSNVDEIYYYFKPPPRLPVAQHFAYDGFQVWFFKGKVTNFSIIHKSVLMPSQ
jgi:hypothetical protein